MTNPPPQARLRLRYRKDEVLQYTGHRDLLRLVMRLIRQAEIPFAYSGGFSPKPKISFAPALPLGVLAENELVDIELAPGATFPTADLLAASKRLIDAAAPRAFFAGLDLLPAGSPRLAQLVQRGLYELVYPIACTSCVSILETDALQVEHKGKTLDLHSAITRWKVEGQILQIEANVAGQPILNIVRLADYLEEHSGLAATQIKRIGFLDANGVLL